MTISPLLREKINIPINKMGPGSSQACFVVIDKDGGIVELFNIVPSIPLETVPLPADQILNSPAFTLFNLTFVKEPFYFRAF